MLVRLLVYSRYLKNKKKSVRCLKRISVQVNGKTVTLNTGGCTVLTVRFGMRFRPRILTICSTFLFFLLLILNFKFQILKQSSSSLPGGEIKEFYLSGWILQQMCFAGGDCEPHPYRSLYYFVSDISVSSHFIFLFIVSFKCKTPGSHWERRRCRTIKDKHKWLTLQCVSLLKGTLENLQASGLYLAWTNTKVMLRRAGHEY